LQLIIIIIIINRNFQDFNRVYCNAPTFGKGVCGITETCWLVYGGRWGEYKLVDVGIVVSNGV
jgi:hypothetical protein